MLDELINYFDLLSLLTLSRVQFFRDRSQTWWGHTWGQDLGPVPSWEMFLVKWAFNELINYFDLLSLLPLSLVRFFSDGGQTWWGCTLGQNLSRINSLETWLVKWVLNEVNNYFDLLSLLLLSRVQFFPDCGQFVRNVRWVKISAELIHGRRGSLNECLS